MCQESEHDYIREDTNSLPMRTSCSLSYQERIFGHHRQVSSQLKSLERLAVAEAEAGDVVRLTLPERGAAAEAQDHHSTVA